MFENPMLDVFIGLIFFYMLLSVIVTVVQEVIASSLSLRSKNLRTAITMLIGADNLQAFYNHPLIFPLFKGEVDDKGHPISGGPSYIPKRSFALAAIDVVSKASCGADPLTEPRQQLPPVLDLIKLLSDPDNSGSIGMQVSHLDQAATDLVAKIASPAVKDAANKALAVAVGRLTRDLGKVDSVIEGVEALFDSTMDRAIGWYKINAQRISLGIALVLAVALNADSFFVGKLLWQDEALRKGVVSSAETYYKSAEGKANLQTICAAKVAADSAPKNAADQLSAVGTCAATQFRAVTAELSPYPIGWPMAAQQQPTGNWLSLIVGGLGILVGWVVTALAMSLGSGFWFDLLSKVMSIRMAGKREPTELSTKS
ncbi:hypothetical protein [uncultured Thiodictyon sp.]|uniref:hypothetical protein n=1 Tax=uncultured Thiodictyon sp. TaxID=1846217 RepID=UPI0025FC6B66|nr:hypothetical protein [uncultured Thiodictyon sp.]